MEQGTEQQKEKSFDTVAWPSCWQYARRGEVGSVSTISFNDPSRMSIRRGEILVYTCDCGAEHKREEGRLIEETRAWITEHTPHLPEGLRE